GCGGRSGGGGLREGGKSVVVLEARDRIGGRVWTFHLPDGSPVDRGGGWLANRHDAILKLASEVGVSTYKTYDHGYHLLVGEGRTRRYRGLIPKISPAAILTIVLAQAKLDRMARRLPVEAPWTAERATEWDGRSVAWFLERSGIRTAIARDLFDSVVRGLFCGDLNQVSFLNLLFLIQASGGFNSLVSIKGGYQENLVVGGAGSIARRVADELGDVVRLNTPVRTILQRADHVVVESAEIAVSARHAVVAIPPVLALEVAL